jgi:hypothetical protein
MFDSTNIRKVSKTNGFIQRERKISATNLLEAVLFANSDPSKISLNDLAVYFKLHFGIKLTRQAIGKKFSTNATRFLKQLIDHLLKINLADGSGTFVNSRFGRITIKDSTCYQLPPKFKGIYPGSGGDGSEASVRIQYEYDLKNLEVLDLEVTPFNNQDRENAKETIGKIRENDLVLRDLGYMDVRVLELINERKAWYISRLNPINQVVDVITNQSIDFIEIEEEMKRTGVHQIERNILLGAKRCPTRLIIELVPERIKEERLRKALRESQRKGRKLTQKKKARIGLNLLLTNCSSKMLSISEVRRIYGIRWQIEMIFKAWKQNLQFHKIKPMNIERFEFLLYAKLIMVMLYWKIYQTVDIIFYGKTRQRISVSKIYKTLNQLSEFTKKIIRGCKEVLSKIIQYLQEISDLQLKHDDRKDRINWKNVINI